MQKRGPLWMVSGLQSVSSHGGSSDSFFLRTRFCVRCLYICHGNTGAIESELPGYLFVGSYVGQCCFRSFIPAGFEVSCLSVDLGLALRLWKTAHHPEPSVELGASTAGSTCICLQSRSHRKAEAGDWQHGVQSSLLVSPLSEDLY